jgi:hypothetical protein
VSTSRTIESDERWLPVCLGLTTPNFQILQDTKSAQNHWSTITMKQRLITVLLVLSGSSHAQTMVHEPKDVASNVGDGHVGLTGFHPDKVKRRSVIVKFQPPNVEGAVVPTPLVSDPPSDIPSSAPTIRARRMKNRNLFDKFAPPDIEEQGISDPPSDVPSMVPTTIARRKMRELERESKSELPTWVM